ncbi:hypothetical protein L6164_013454 [Bauhinia variegata]|uniref:Uncharacterized protein n=1 Tax=Bauhinia variegata TaxID=167791 RepID=A0ACB9NFN2_BAUVA|nr:hypothetical protein L6164_013454 [Bauhinia variegata]
MFHVSQSKAATGQLPADPEIPIELEQEIPVVEPEEFLKHRTIHRNNRCASSVGKVEESASALEMQGKHNEAKLEMSKTCLLLRIFPPDESSPQMEMVARGLEKHLKLEQREHLMDVFAKVCGDDSHRIAREALGLINYESLSQ